MSKKVSFSARPPSSSPMEPVPIYDPSAIDAWVNNEKHLAQEPTKRFTFEVTASLHKRIKLRCAADERQMADVIRELLDKHFPAG